MFVFVVRLLHSLHTLILSLPSPSDVSIEADNVDIEANDDFHDAGDDISLDASNDVTIGAGSNVTIEGDSGVDIKSDGGNINLDAFTSGTGPTAGGNINLGADVDIDIALGLSPLKLTMVILPLMLEELMIWNW